MSSARTDFIASTLGIQEAVAMDPIAQGAKISPEPAGVVALRRGILIAAQIALETFIRMRTTELLSDLSNWPGSFQQLPLKLREAALLNALPNLQKYAVMLKRQDEDYENEIVSQLAIMASTTGPFFGFTKFISGDHTGNMSEQSVRELLSIFQVSDCWTSFRIFSAEIGFGVPSVKELFSEMVRKRHRSAHSYAYTPTVADISNLPNSLICLGICFDASMTASITQALCDWQKWADGQCKWRDSINIFFADQHGIGYRFHKLGSKKAIRLITKLDETRSLIKKSRVNEKSIVITRDSSLRPRSWHIIA